MRMHLDVIDAPHERRVKLRLGPAHLATLLQAGWRQVEETLPKWEPVTIAVPHEDGEPVTIQLADPQRAHAFLSSVLEDARELLRQHADIEAAKRRRNAAMAAAGASPLSKRDTMLKGPDGEILGMQTEYFY